MNSNWWKYGLFLGLGFALGAVGAVLVSRNPGAAKKACASVLSHALDVKDKATAMMETAKENIEDLAAEAREDLTQRKQAAAAAG
ncbi:MAG: hypothetical protein LBR22_07325 [Desulfovibrio sp.]|jgi:hypothetical protein|nr:hypothetical protein [Desulfovibrio sp.]